MLNHYSVADLHACEVRYHANIMAEHVFQVVESPVGGTLDLLDLGHEVVVFYDHVVVVLRVECEGGCVDLP